MEYKKCNQAIATMMQWSYIDQDDNPYTTDQLLLVLLALTQYGWKWQIYANSRHLSELAIKIEREDIKYYAYGKAPAFALYVAVYNVLIT